MDTKDNDDESQPLLEHDRQREKENIKNAVLKLIHQNRKLLLVLMILVLVSISVITPVLVCVLPSAPLVPGHQSSVRVLSLSVWGSPASFGAEDKEERIQAIGEYIRDHNDTLDVVMLQELWMRPDHATIESLIQNTGFTITNVGDLAPSSICDGRAAPTFCSGLALVTRLPIKQISFTSFSVHGDLWWNDGEYFARRGTGQVTLVPSDNISLDVMLTSVAANNGDDNSYYRQIQAREFGDAVRQSSADYVIAGGNFEVDPRSSETTYTDVSRGLSDSRHQYLGESWLDSSLATYGNRQNSYSKSKGALLLDYLLHKTNQNKHITVTSYRVPILKTKTGKSFSNHEAVEATYSLL